MLRNSILGRDNTNQDFCMLPEMGDPELVWGEFHLFLNEFWQEISKVFFSLFS